MKDHHQQGRAEALRQVAAHLRSYAKRAEQRRTWWPMARARAEGVRMVLAELERFAGQLEAEAGKPAPTGIGGIRGWIGRLFR